MSIETSSKLNRLLTNGISGGLYFSESLKQKGYSDQLLKQYRNSGWLKSLAKGVMYRSGDHLSALRALSCYNAQMHKDFRIAAHSALEIYGFNHYVPMGKPVLMVAHTDSRVPGWMHLPDFDREIKPFSTSIFQSPEVAAMNLDQADMLVSTPELAFMECLYLAGKQYGYMDLYYIMEQLTSLRPDVLQRTLENTKSFRVKRMFLYMAEKAGHYWFHQLNSKKIELGTSKLQLVRHGVFIPKYQITIPQELKDYE